MIDWNLVVQSAADAIEKHLPEEVQPYAFRIAADAVQAALDTLSVLQGEEKISEGDGTLSSVPSPSTAFDQTNTSQEAQ